MRIIKYVFAFLLPFGATYADCVKSPWVNLKDGPGKNFNTKWVVPKNTPLKVIQRKGSWFLIEEVDRVRSWVKSAALTDRYFCGIVKRERIKIQDYLTKRTKFAYYDESFKIIKIKQKKWVLVKNQLGTKGWAVKKSLWVH